jgi:hypothetical protein
MKKGQVIKDVALYPMEVLALSQGMYGSFSHKGSMAIDIIGSGGGIEEAYAPFDLSIVWKDSLSGNGLCFQSDRAVLWANGEYEYVHFVMWHMNDIKAYSVGQKFKQGEKIYEEGTAGFATGNHIHLNVAKGKYGGGYPLVKNASNVWVIKNQVAPMDVFYINDTVVRNAFGYEWKTYVAPKNVIDRKGLPTLTVLANSLNYRKSPNGERLGQLPMGAILPYLGKSGVVNGFEWAEVLHEDELVYCAIEPTWNEITVPEKEVIVEVTKPVDETFEKEGMKVRVVIL